MNRTIINFGGNVRFEPRHVYEPATEQEVLDILNRHAKGKVRVAGAKHAWSPGIVSDDAFIDLKQFDKVEVHHKENAVTVGGGCRIKHLLRKLHAQSDLTLPSIGLITEQSAAGAISTATHGSGKHSLSHYVEELRVAAYDANGKACIYSWNGGEELQAARCAVGCLGIILSVRFRCVPRYDVAETLVTFDTLDEVLAGEGEFPLQQFYFLPHRWTYLVQRRATVPLQPRSWRATLYRAYWHIGIDIGLHLVVKTLVSVLKSHRLTRAFYRHALLKLIPLNRTVVDRADKMLVMEHELFRHLEIEIFVPAKHVRAAAAYAQSVLEVFDGAAPSNELQQYRGTFTHHYVICFRRVLPEDAMISMTSGGEPYYAMSFITYVMPREPFLAMAHVLAEGMAKRFDARPHWGKFFPLDGATVQRLYPRLPEFRAICQRYDPHGVFRNEFVERTLFSTESR